MRNVLDSLMLVSSMLVGCDEAPAPVEQEGHEATSAESQIDDTADQAPAVEPPATPDPAVQAAPAPEPAQAPTPAAAPAVAPVPAPTPAAQ